MNPTDPQAARKFAVETVRTLRDNGHEALWAGGCVRDALLGKIPKDYDVATNAAPAEVRRVFGHRRTLPIGAAFGVITLVGSKASGPIEIATFRQDAAYSDGRHPDGVVFSTAKEDAQRRDFTINGLFFDPLSEKVIDYVGGQTDLQAGLIRAIGDPSARIGEDKLRMLRAVRFAANFDFQLENETWAALCREATGIQVVSAERIGAEMRRMLVHSNRRKAVELLRDSGLLREILPCTNEPLSESSLAVLHAISEPTFATALAALLWEQGQLAQSLDRLADTANRWRLSGDEKQATQSILQCAPVTISAAQTPWPQVQRILISPHIDETLKFARAVQTVQGITLAGVEFCEQKRKLDQSELNPPPLISGNELRSTGLNPGPQFKTILETVRDEQLEGRLTSTEEALSWVKEHWNL